MNAAMQDKVAIVTGAVRLIHWNAAEAEERADRLRSAGYEGQLLDRLAQEVLRSRQRSVANCRTPSRPRCRSGGLDDVLRPEQKFV